MDTTGRYKVINIKPAQLPDSQNNEESYLGTAGRLGAQGLSRAFETASGSVGDVLSGALGATNYLTGGRTPTYEKFQEGRPLSPRTSSQIKRDIGSLTQGYTEPKDKVEEFYGDVVSDLTGLLGGSALTGGKLPFKNSLLRSISGNLASETAGALGGGELTKAVSKFATMGLVGGLGTRKELAKRAQENYARADELKETFKHKSFDAPKLNKFTKELLEEVSFGVKTPEKKILKEALDPIQDAFFNNKININNAKSFKKDINQLIRNKSTPYEAKKTLGKISRMLLEPLEEAGKVYPEWYKNWSEAQKITEGLKSSEDIIGFISKHGKLSQETKKNLYKFTKAGAGLGGLGSTAYSIFTKGLVPTLGTATKVGLGAKLGKDLVFKPLASMYKNPVIKKYYGDVIKNAARQNIPAMQRSLTKFEHAYNKYEEQENKNKPRFKVLRTKGQTL